MINTMTPKDLAEHLNISPKEVRKFLRAITPDRAGKGGRWMLDIRDLDAIEARYIAWKSSKVTTLTLED